MSMKRARSESLRLNGHLVRPGDFVEIISGPYSGHKGVYRGTLRNNRVAVNVRLGAFVPTQLRLQREQIAARRILSAQKRTKVDKT